MYGLESYVSVPIILADGRYFGNLCAIDRTPAKVSDPRIVSMFQRFAEIIAQQLESELSREEDHTALLDERASSELREQFIAILGHDLRNPLQAVFAGSDLLQRKLADPVLGGVAARIKVNARRMSAMIDDVLDFARGRLGPGIGVTKGAVADVSASLAAVVTELQDAQPGRDIRATFVVDRPLVCDIGRVQQLASNLLANALTHGAPHSPVQISATTDERDLILSVVNEGAPIAPENLHRIFEPYWRHSTAGGRSGLGLGLYICSQIVRAHGGQMTVTSTLEHGTRFTARLPLDTGG